MTRIFSCLALASVIAIGCTRTSERAPAPTAENASTSQAAMTNTEGDGKPADKRTFAKPSAAELKSKLTPLQYEVTQNDATERPYNNDYWDNKGAGLYVDVVSGEPLFTSMDKFDSGTGWPSFTKPVEDQRVVERHDTKHGMERVEVRSKTGDSHLGHLFNDGPAPTGQRYCINSASLRFIPVDQLEAEGYGAYLPLFEKK